MSIGFPTAPLALRHREGGGAMENPQAAQHFHPTLTLASDISAGSGCRTGRFSGRCPKRARISGLRPA